MHPVEYYLKELLYDFDCVTIPGLGGFIVQTCPSRIDQGKNRIYPPSRNLSFNSLLNHDDGLLVSRIAVARHVSYSDAASIAGDFVSVSKKKLSSGQSVMLKGIGELSSLPGGEIVFRQSERVNLQAGVYGMASINIYSLPGPQQRIRSVQKPEDRKPVRMKGKRPASVRWTLALSLPVILFLLYGIIFPFSVHDIYTGYSGLDYGLTNPRRVPAVVTAPSSAKSILLPKTAVIAPSPVIVPEKSRENITEEINPGSPKFYIIGGCFEKEENAVKFLEELINRGFDAEKAGSTNSGHIRISYKSFTDKPAAMSYLQKIRNEENSSAWLLKY